MPTYAYACTACDHRFEAQQSFTDAALTECPECSGRLRKLFSSVGIVFKGSGFYRTDSRKGGGEAKAEGDGAAARDGKAKETAGASTSSATKGGDGGSSTGGSASGKTSGATSGGTGSSKVPASSGSAA